MKLHFILSVVILLLVASVQGETKQQCQRRCERVYKDCYDQSGDDAMCSAEAAVCDSECGMIDPYYST